MFRSCSCRRGPAWSDLERGRLLGAIDYVTKPFDPIELPDRLREDLELLREGGGAGRVWAVAVRLALRQDPARAAEVPTPQDREAARRAQRPVQAALALLIVVVVVLVAAGGLAAYRIYTKANQRFIDQAGPFFAVTEDLSVEMLNEETGVRGFVITGDPSTLAPYRQGKKYVRLELAVIAKDQAFDPHIPPHLRTMRREVASLEAFFAKEIALVRTGLLGNAERSSRRSSARRISTIYAPPPGP